MGRVHAQKLGAYWLTSVGSLAMQYSLSIIFVDLLGDARCHRGGRLVECGTDGWVRRRVRRAIARCGEVVCGSLGALLSGLGLRVEPMSQRCGDLVTYPSLGAVWKSTGVSTLHQVISRHVSRR